MLAAIRKLLASKTVLRPTYLTLRRLKHLCQKLSYSVKQHAKTLWFLFCHVLPLLIRTGTRPVIFLRYLALGDIIRTFPAAHQLKLRHPGASFIYYCRQDYACLPRMGGVTTHVVSNLDVVRIETTYSIFFSAIYRFTYSDEYEKSASTESVIKEYCRQHGVPICDTYPRLQINRAALSKAKLVLESPGLNRAGPVIAIHPGPTGPNREWNNECWAGLVRALIDAGFNNIVQLGAGRSDDLGTALRARIPDVVSLVNKLSLEESIAFISLCDLLIGIDSGLLHIAASVGTPAVGIFGSTSPQFIFSATTDLSPVVSRVACQGCQHRVPRLHWITGCPFNFECMRSIRVDDVLQACFSRLPPSSSAKQESPCASQDKRTTAVPLRSQAKAMPSHTSHRPRVALSSESAF